jgi:hypothetical protein
MTHPNSETLRLLYEDFSRLDEYATEDIRLHPADRTVGTPPIAGTTAALAHEKALVEATGGTLFMEVESICANDFFGAVIGTLRSSSDGAGVAMPFCGLWRFEDGQVTEHWENAYDPSALGLALGAEARS